MPSPPRDAAIRPPRACSPLPPTAASPARDAVTSPPDQARGSPARHPLRAPRTPSRNRTVCAASGTSSSVLHSSSLRASRHRRHCSRSASLRRSEADRQTSLPTPPASAPSLRSAKAWLTCNDWSAEHAFLLNVLPSATTAASSPETPSSPACSPPPSTTPTTPLPAARCTTASLAAPSPPSRRRRQRRNSWLRSATTRQPSFKDQEPGNKRRRDLAHGCGPATVDGSTPRLRQLPEQRHIHRKQRRLRYVVSLQLRRRVEPSSPRTAPREAASPSIVDNAARRRPRTSRGTPHRLRQQRPAHAELLAALPGEHKHQLAAIALALLPSDTAACGRPSPSARSASTASDASRADTEAREANCVRCNAAVLTTADQSTSACRDSQSA